MRPVLAAIAATLLGVLPPATGAPRGPGPASEAAVAQGAPGVIRGRLHIRQPLRVPLPRPDLNRPDGGPLRRAAEPRPGVVYLETAPRGAFEDREAARAVMDQRDETFVPHVLAVMAGAVVEFPNNDRTFHNVFSLSRAKRFDLGRYAAGRSKSVRFDRPGVVRVFCDIHAHMNAFILVFTHPFFQVTGPDGRFRLDRVPPGAYTLVGWHDGESRTAVPVTLPPGGTVEVDLVF